MYKEFIIPLEIDRKQIIFFRIVGILRVNKKHYSVQ